MSVSDFEGMKAAISKRYDVAHELGCRASDHALDYVMYVPATADEIEAIFAKGLAAEPLTEEEVLKYKTAFMQFVAGEYVRLGWAMQLHFGCKRDNNRAMFAQARSRHRLRLHLQLHAVRPARRFPQLHPGDLRPAQDHPVQPEPHR